MSELQPLKGIDAHFTDFRYLSMNRSFMKLFLLNIKNDMYDKDIEEFYITVDNIDLNLKKLVKNITYNEHRYIIRWDKHDWKKCICDPNSKKLLIKGE